MFNNQVRGKTNRRFSQASVFSATFSAESLATITDCQQYDRSTAEITLICNSRTSKNRFHGITSLQLVRMANYPTRFKNFDNGSLCLVTKLLEQKSLK